MSSLAGCRVTVMGLGRHGGGLGATRWLAAQGAVVTVTDLAAAEALRASLEALAGVPIARYRLGEHRAEDFLAADMVVVNPAVRPGHPLVAAAAAVGSTITSEIELFLQRCPAQIVGITGTNGKSTTATLMAAMLQAGGRRTWLGGNIGTSLLADLPAMQPDDVVVLELSSFQLAQLGPAVPLPQLAVVTNCTPNHLDWHGSFADYAAAKQRLVRGLGSAGTLILGPAAPELIPWAALTRARVALSAAMPCVQLPELRVPGEHNRSNAAAALAVAVELGCPVAAARTVLAEFGGLEHRLQLVANCSGRRFYNDSKATSSAAAQAALAAVPGPIWWLAGGQAKEADFAALADQAVRRVQGAALFGASRELLATALRAADRRLPVYVTEHLRDALDWCWRQSAAGDAILLSPACASFDQFADFEDRGRRFVALVEQLS